MVLGGWVEDGAGLRIAYSNQKCFYVLDVWLSNVYCSYLPVPHEVHKFHIHPFTYQCNMKLISFRFLFFVAFIGQIVEKF